MLKNSENTVFFLMCFTKPEDEVARGKTRNMFIKGKVSLKYFIYTQIDYL